MEPSDAVEDLEDRSDSDHGDEGEQARKSSWLLRFSGPRKEHKHEKRKKYHFTSGTMYFDEGDEVHSSHVKMEAWATRARMLSGSKAARKEFGEEGYGDAKDKVPKIVVVLPHFLRKGKNIRHETWKLAAEFAPLVGGQGEVLVPYFRTQHERPPGRSDRLAWGDRDRFDNSRSNQGEYSKLGKKGVDMTSFEVMDKIVGRLLRRVKHQLIVTGHSGGCQFVQRWMLVSNIAYSLFEKANMRISVLFDSCGSYGFLDFYRPTAFWKERNCLGGHTKARKRCESPTPGGRTDPKLWTEEYREQLPAKIYNRKKRPNNPWRLGNYRDYLPVLIDDSKKTHRRPENYEGGGNLFAPYVVPAWLHKARGYRHFSAFRHPHTISKEDVGKHLRAHVIPRFQINLVLNRGDRCLCLKQHYSFQWQKGLLTEREYKLWFMEPGHCNCKRGKEVGIAKKLSAYLVRTSKLALTGGFQRYQRAQVWKWWMHWHVPGLLGKNARKTKLGWAHRGKYGFRTWECTTCVHNRKNGKSLLRMFLKANKKRRFSKLLSKSELAELQVVTTDEVPEAGAGKLPASQQLLRRALDIGLAVTTKAGAPARTTQDFLPRGDYDLAFVSAIQETFASYLTDRLAQVRLFSSSNATKAEKEPIEIPLGDVVAVRVSDLNARGAGTTSASATAAAAPAVAGLRKKNVATTAPATSTSTAGAVQLQEAAAGTIAGPVTVRVALGVEAAVRNVVTTPRRLEIAETAWPTVGVSRAPHSLPDGKRMEAKLVQALMKNLGTIDVTEVRVESLHPTETFVVAAALANRPVVVEADDGGSWCC
eukprot:g11882.t1